MHTAGHLSGMVPLSPTLNLPEHTGSFYEMGSSELHRIKLAGYRYIGMGIALLNTAGEVLVADHKGNDKLEDHTLSVLSETVAFEDPVLRTIAEPNIRTIGRCLLDERGFNPTLVQATTRLTGESLTFIDAISGNKANPRRILGINIALLLSDESAKQAVEEIETDEIYGAYFRDAAYLMDESRALVRPGVRECLQSLGTAGLLDTVELSEARLHFPSYDYGQEVVDIDLDLVN